MLRTEELLRQVAQEIFEKLAFMIPENGAPAEDPEEPVCQAVVDFDGAFSGSIQVAIPARMLSALARNMIGLDAEDPVSEHQCMDAMGEFANVLCGNLLARLVGPNPEFDLAPPEVKTGSDLEGPRFAQQTAVALTLEEGWTRLRLQLDEEGAAVLAASAHQYDNRR